MLSNYIQNSPKHSKKLIEILYSKKKFELLKMLIPKYFDVNLPIIKGILLFDMASYCSDSEMMIYLLKEGDNINYERLYINDEFIDTLFEIKYPDISKVIHEGKYFRKYDEKEIEYQKSIMILYTIYYENYELFKYFVEKISNLNECCSFNNNIKTRISHKYYFKDNLYPIFN